MRTHKHAFAYMAVIGTVALGTSLWLESMSRGLDFWVNTLLGVFASAALVMVQSGISYRIEREESLWKLYETAVHLLNKIDRAKVKMSSRSTDVAYLYDLVSQSVDYYFIDFSASVKQVSFAVKRGKLEACARAIDRDSQAVYVKLRAVHSYLDEVLVGSAVFSTSDSRFRDWVGLQEDEAFIRLTERAIQLRQLLFRS